MHADLRASLREQTKEHNMQRKFEAAESEKKEIATMHLHHITRKMPVRPDTI